MIVIIFIVSFGESYLTVILLFIKFVIREIFLCIILVIFFHVNWFDVLVIVRIIVPILIEVLVSFSCVYFVMYLL